MKSELGPLLSNSNKLDWRLEKADAQTIVIYQLNAGKAAVDKLRERLSASPRPHTLVLNRDPGVELGVPTLVLSANEWDEALALACDYFFPLPPKLKLLAVTGTNGKSTTVDLVLQLADQAGLKGFSIGTLGVRSAGHTLEEFGLTTPGPIQLRKILYDYGATSDFCVMETSSHAIEQGRIRGLRFQAAAWTSFSQDHLDYHHTMENYFAAKCGLLRYLAPGGALYVPVSQKKLLADLRPHSNVRATKAFSDEIKKELPAFFGASFNVDNLECAAALLTELGAAVDEVNWPKLVPPPGRFNVTSWDERLAIVDFAHTPDALENICRAIRQSYPGKKLTVLFGCGGDRDRTKRPLMGQAVARWADAIILTSDNPRSENPERIIQDIADGIRAFSSLTTEVDRPKALAEALGSLGKNEILLVAGKGHEDYIHIGQVKIPYSDQGVIDKFLEGMPHD